MPKFVLIDKSGTVKTVNVKELSTDTLYKRTGFKTPDGFILRHTWGPEDGLDQSIELYAKSSGKSGQENKYDFPPPVDTALFFGSCALLGRNPETGTLLDLTETEWAEIYEYLFGGFEDIGSEDSDEDEFETDDEVDELAASNGIVLEQTKQGYVKDGFIVDDEDEDAVEDEDEEEYRAPVKKTHSTKSRPPKKTVTIKSNVKESVKAKPADNVNAIVEALNVVEDCESELSEEAYV